MNVKIEQHIFTKDLKIQISGISWNICYWFIIFMLQSLLLQQRNMPTFPLRGMSSMNLMLQGKCLMDDKFMSAVFKDFPEGVELVLRIILEIPDLTVEKADTQLTLTNLLGRTVRIDVFATDSKGVRYNIEIQKASKGTGFKRARYHSSMLDSNDPAIFQSGPGNDE